MGLAAETLANMLTMDNSTTLTNTTLIDNSTTLTDNYTKIEKFDPNAAFPPAVNIGVPILCIALFVIALLLVYFFPSKVEDDVLCQMCLPMKGAKRKPGHIRRARHNSQRLEEEQV